MAINLIFVDRDEAETHFIKKMYYLRYSIVDRGGPLELTATIPIDLIANPIKRLDDVKLYDGLDLIWFGRVKEIPQVSVSREAAVLTAEGFVGHLKDERVDPTLSLPDSSDQIIQSVLTANNTKQTIPVISTDFSRMSTGTFDVTTFDVDIETTPLTLIKRANAFDSFDWGLNDLDVNGAPRFTWKTHDRTVADYKVGLRRVNLQLQGRSLDDVYNKAYVSYGDFSQEERTGTDDLLDARGLSRAISLGDLSLTQADAQQVGDSFLNDKRNASKGTLVVTTSIFDNKGRTVPVHRILPGRNILIYDLEPDEEDLTTINSSDVINGKNVFKITQVDVDFGNKTASLELDVPNDRLDIMLSRIGNVEAGE